jgi:hypothetical protein
MWAFGLRSLIKTSKILNWARFHLQGWQMLVFFSAAAVFRLADVPGSQELVLEPMVKALQA